MAKKANKETDRRKAKQMFEIIDVKEFFALVDGAIAELKECEIVDDDALRAFGLKMFLYGYDCASKNIRFIQAKSGGTA